MDNVGVTMATMVVLVKCSVLVVPITHALAKENVTQKLEFASVILLLMLMTTAQFVMMVGLAKIVRSLIVACKVLLQLTYSQNAETVKHIIGKLLGLA